MAEFSRGKCASVNSISARQLDRARGRLVSVGLSRCAGGRSCVGSGEDAQVGMRTDSVRDAWGTCGFDRLAGPSDGPIGPSPRVVNSMLVGQHGVVRMSRWALACWLYPRASSVRDVRACAR
jgi:hypothetical protein